MNLGTKSGTVSNVPDMLEITGYVRNKHELTQIPTCSPILKSFTSLPTLKTNDINLEKTHAYPATTPTPSWPPIKGGTARGNSPRQIVTSEWQIPE
jgi:hypothetical protein